MPFRLFFWFRFGLSLRRPERRGHGDIDEPVVIVPGIEPVGYVTLLRQAGQTYDANTPGNAVKGGGGLLSPLPAWIVVILKDQALVAGQGSERLLGPIAGRDSNGDKIQRCEAVGVLLAFCHKDRVVRDLLQVVDAVEDLPVTGVAQKPTALSVGATLKECLSLVGCS